MTAAVLAALGWAYGLYWEQIMALLLLAMLIGIVWLTVSGNSGGSSRGSGW